MELITGWVVDLSNLSRDYLSLISLALAAVIVVFAGKPVTTWGGSWINRMPALLRFPVRALFNLALLGAMIYFLLAGWRSC